MHGYLLGNDRVNKIRGGNVKECFMKKLVFNLNLE